MAAPVRTIAEINSQLNKKGWAVDGSPGYTTHDTLKRFQTSRVLPDGKPLDIDGRFGEQSEDALFGNYKPSNTSLSELTVRVAKALLGISEVPAGKNRGPQVDIFQRAVGIDLGSSWCMAFLYFCIQQACSQLGIANSFPKTGGCMDAWDKAKKAGLTRITAAEARKDSSLVEVGMVAIWLIAPLTRAGHTGIVAGWVDDKVGGKLITYEGNSNENASREGIIVARQTKRTLSDKILVGFIKLT